MIGGVVTILFAMQVGAAADATLTGVVSDVESGAPLAGAIVALADAGRFTLADARGRYALRSTAAGPTHLSVRAIGYRPRSLHALVPAQGLLEVNVALTKAAVPLSVVAITAWRGAERETAEAPSVGLDREVVLATIWDNPLLAEPDALQALSGGEVAVRPESPAGLHVRGGSSEHTAYVVDGIPVLNPYHSAGMLSAWNPDALARLRLASSSPSPELPASLSGSVEAETRSPGAALHTRGGLSTTHARLTADGPLGAAGAGFLVSTRIGYPAMVAPGREASFVRGGNFDALGKVELPLLGGALELLGYLNTNALDAAAGVGPDSVTSRDGLRNRFGWESQSFGGSWRRPVASGTVRISLWSAASTANSDWLAGIGAITLDADRHDLGAKVSVERRHARATTTVGARIETHRTEYAIAGGNPTSPAQSMASRLGVPSLYAQQRRDFGHGVSLDAAADLSMAKGVPRFGPRASVRWQATEALAFATSYARTHQFLQSMRNGESVVGTIFPADLFVSAGSRSVPVARSRQVVVGADYTPRGSLRVGLQLYDRALDGLLLVAPRDGEPFALSDALVGSGTARGFSADLSLGASRLSWTLRYGMQQVYRRANDFRYAPEHGATQSLEGGVNVYPSPTTALRFGVVGLFGRRATAITNVFDFESCNLMDRGCEFGGSPRADATAVGGTRVPAYLRTDLGVRQHVHLLLGGRDVQLAFYATYSNLLGRRNVLTFTRDPTTGALEGVGMRPPSPFVFGLDWRY